MGSAMADDRLTTLLAALPKDATTFSLEFFPPKTQAGFANLQPRLARMTAGLRPLFITVTWGAGGSTAVKSLDLAAICQRQLGVPTVLHLTCTNMNRRLVDEALKECKEAGIRNILALRGDPPRDEYREEEEEEEEAQEASLPKTEAQEQEFVWAVDLVTYIKRKHGDYFCIGVAGYPEGYAEESCPEAGKQSVEHDLPYLAEKVRPGADFIMTQLTFDVEAYRIYEDKVRNYVDKDGTKIFKTIPIIPGLMPIQSYQIIRRITKLSHAKMPDNLAKRIEEVKSDDDLVKKVGVDILSEIVEKIRTLPTPNSSARILHFYTLNLEKSVTYILERCKLIPSSNQPQSDTTESENNESSEAVTDGTTLMPATDTRAQKQRSSPSAQPHNRVIQSQSKGPASDKVNDHELPSSDTTRKHLVSDTGSGVPASAPTRAHNLLISEGQGALGREATWDDFPNGRWGPSHSPAFGEIDGYGPSMKVGPITARKLWGRPSTREDVTELFRRHVTGELEAVPWSDDIDVDVSTGGANGALRAETEVIRQDLLRLIQQKGYWTLASQPAVDGARSDDPVVGWGPKGEGFVFQKAFVEFFCSRDDWVSLKQSLVKASLVEFSWLKTDAQGSFESSDEEGRTVQRHGKGLGAATYTSKRTPGASGVNAVTWGVFRGKEIVSPTIIEPESFRAWGEEAFSIWEEWRRCFPRGSVEEQCLEKIKKDIVLVNVVGQTYIGGHAGLGGGLWKVLLGGKDVVDPRPA